MNQQTTYTARPGSKPALAIQALLDGPLTTMQLAEAIGCKSQTVAAQLGGALRGRAIIRVMDTVSRKSHYALAGMPLDSRYSEEGDRDVSTPHQVTRSAADTATAGRKPSDVDPNDPFGLVAAQRQRAAPLLTKARGAGNPPATPADDFIASLSSLGNLTITVDGVSVVLTPAHQEQLQEFQSRFKA